jgi:hypothetical protein
VKNGDNLDDGPIFDFYYKMKLHVDLPDKKLTRFNAVEGLWAFCNPN